MKIEIDSLYNKAFQILTSISEGLEKIFRFIAYYFNRLPTFLVMLVILACHLGVKLSENDAE